MKKLNYFNWRFLLIIIFLIIAVLAIFIRVIYLQVDKENFLKDWGQNQHIAFRTSAPVRGTIYDRNNVPLAITLTHYDLYALRNMKEEDFIALKEHKEVKLAEVDKEKRILMGAALIPNKKIYRNSGKEEYYIFFSEDTVRKASELFLMNGNQNNSTLEHNIELQGMSVVESWIIEDEVHDKSRKYGLEMPMGTWMASIKVNNDEIWEEFVKTKRVKGFSIEGFFTDKKDERPQESVDEELVAQEAIDFIKKVLNQID